MLTIQILTLNDARTIEATVDSALAVADRVLVGDFGSTDATATLCRQRGCHVFDVSSMRRDVARNALSQEAGSGPQFALFPWETFLSGAEALNRIDRTAHVGCLHEGVLTKEIRAWVGESRFRNPVFETFDEPTEEELPIMLGSCGGLEARYVEEKLKRWKLDEPLSPWPHYFEAWTHLARNDADGFFRAASAYFFVEPEKPIASTMLRYFQAYFYLTKRREVRPALQNLNLCLCENPLMAEFWCLTGDVHYHLTNDLRAARRLYRNAVILGSRRLRSDKWPMHVAKYGKYPRMMIESCEKLSDQVP